MNKITVDEFILNSGQWEAGLILLREILLDSGLEETVKWNMPVYTWKEKNIVGIAAYKYFFGLIFYQGALLKDELNLLHEPENSNSRILRQCRFQSAEEVRDKIEGIILYVEEAIENQKLGKEIKPDFNKPIIIPDELQQALDNDAGLKRMFNLLSKSKQREYAYYISQAKMPETRERRLKKIIALMLMSTS